MSKFSRQFDVAYSNLIARSDDPLLACLPERYGGKARDDSTKNENMALTLLNKTNLSNERKDAQYSSKIEHKSLLLQPTTRTEDSRAEKAEKERRRREAKRKPRPLSSKEKRASGLKDIPKEACRYAIYEPLNKLWTGYMKEIMKGGSSEAKLLKADYHGALLKVVKCSCPSFLFLQGIVIKETRHTFVICTVEDRIKTLPKKCTVFEFQVLLESSDDQEKDKMPEIMKWEVYGEHFGFRAAERVGKKFKGKSTIDF